MSRVHAPTRFSTYFRVHNTRMARWRAGPFVVGDNLEWSVGATVVQCRGAIVCLGNMYIAVAKDLALTTENEHQMVETIGYAYTVGIHAEGPLFRYDNAHSWPGHKDEHHKHIYPYPFEDRNDVVWMGVAGWPMLSEVIEEA